MVINLNTMEVKTRLQKTVQYAQVAQGKEDLATLALTVAQC